MDWYDEIRVNNDLKINYLRFIGQKEVNTNKTLWGNFLIEYKKKKYYSLVILDLIFIKNWEKNTDQST